VHQRALQVTKSREPPCYGVDLGFGTRDYFAELLLHLNWGQRDQEFSKFCQRNGFLCITDSVNFGPRKSPLLPRPSHDRQPV